MHLDTKNKNNKLNINEFEKILRNIFIISETIPLSPVTDLSEYIIDSIDLGELLAVLNEKYNIQPRKVNLFSKYSSLEDILKIINDEKFS